MRERERGGGGGGQRKGETARWGERERDLGGMSGRVSEWTDEWVNGCVTRQMSDTSEWAGEWSEGQVKRTKGGSRRAS